MTSHRRFLQHYRGLPIDDAQVVVNLAPDSTVESQNDRSEPNFKVDAPTLGIKTERVETDVVGHRLVWHVAVAPPDETFAPAIESAIDAKDGSVVGQKQLTDYDHSVPGTAFTQYSDNRPITLDLISSPVCDDRPYAAIDLSRGEIRVLQFSTGSVPFTMGNTLGNNGRLPSPTSLRAHAAHRRTWPIIRP